MRRLILIMVLLVFTILISSCGAGSEKAISSPTPTPNTISVEDVSKKLSTLAEKGGSKQELLSGLLEKGDIASKDEKDRQHKRARWAYTFANLLDSANEDVAMRLKSLGGPIADDDSDARLRVSMTMMSTVSDDNVDKIFGKFPKLTPGMELVNLRMLLDERLLGDLGYAQLWMNLSGSQLSISLEEPTTKPEGRNSQLWVFLKEPTININKVRSAYGKPSTEQKDMFGTRITTYGLFRFLSDKDGKIEGILFPAADGHIPKS